MRSKGWSILGVSLTGAMVVLSAVINYRFGYSLGTTETNARIFGLVSVVAVVAMAVLPWRVSMHWEADRKGKAALGAAMFAILLVYAIAGSIGFGMQNRSHLAGGQETLNARLEDQLRDRDQADSRLRGLREDQPAAAYRLKIEAAKKDRRWDQTKGCTNATAMGSRDFCQGVDRIRAQLDVAATATVLREKIERLNLSVENLRAQGAGQVADPQSLGLATIFRVRQEAVWVGLSILLALVIESVCCFGLLVIVGGREPVRKEIGMTVPEWFGRWLSEQAEPAPASRISFVELEADFQEWARGKGAPKVRSRAFTRLMGAACQEIGLAAADRVVQGLRLKPRRLIAQRASPRLGKLDVSSANG
jgi:hypothetical protein